MAARFADAGRTNWRIDLVDTNHHPLDKGVITFVVPEKSADEKHP